MYKINNESIGDVKKYVWHYRKDNNEYGPFTYEDIVEMVMKGVIGPDDYVLKFGNRKFVKVSEVQGLANMIERSEEKEEEQAEIPEEQHEEMHEEIKEETPEIKKEKVKEEYHVTYENRAKYVHRKRKKESFGQKIALIIACIVGLCFIAGLLIWLF